MAKREKTKLIGRVVLDYQNGFIRLENQRAEYDKEYEGYLPDNAKWGTDRMYQIKDKMVYTGIIEMLAHYEDLGIPVTFKVLEGDED